MIYLVLLWCHYRILNDAAFLCPDLEHDRDIGRSLVMTHFWNNWSSAHTFYSDATKSRDATLPHAGLNPMVPLLHWPTRTVGHVTRLEFMFISPQYAQIFSPIEASVATIVSMLLGLWIRDRDNCTRCRESPNFWSHCPFEMGLVSKLVSFYPYLTKRLAFYLQIM